MGNNLTEAGSALEGSSEKKKELFLAQKKTLDTFLENGAITKAQYEKSLYDLADKMNLSDLL